MNGLSFGIRVSSDNQHLLLASIYSIFSQNIQLPFEIILAGAGDLSFLPPSILQHIKILATPQNKQEEHIWLLNNQIMQCTHYDHIVFMNERVILTDGWYVNYKKFCTENRLFYDVLSFPVKNTDGSRHLDWFIQNNEDQHTLLALQASAKEVTLPGHFFALKKHVWDKVPWCHRDQPYHTNYHWTQRIKKKGLQLMLCKGAYAYHNHGSYFQFGDQILKDHSSKHISKRETWLGFLESQLRNNYETERCLISQLKNARDFPFPQYPMHLLSPQDLSPTCKESNQTLHRSETPYIVIWIGRVGKELGYGSASRGYIQAILRTQVKVIAFDSETQRVVGPTHGIQLNIYRNSNDDLTIIPSDPKINFITIIHERPDWAENIVVKGGPSALLFVFETTSFPSSWKSATEHFEYIWTASTFNMETFTNAGIPKNKLSKVPHCIDTSCYDPCTSKITIDDLKSFVFLTVLSNPNRKDLGMILRAYYRRFSMDDDVSLLVKLPPRIYADDFEQIVRDPLRPEFEFEEDDSHRPHIKFLYCHYSVDEMIQLYNTCDVLISMDRGKGWDMTSMEAMAIGKAVIGTDWGGSNEFMHPNRCFLVQTEKQHIPLDQVFMTGPAHALYRGHYWPAILDHKLEEQMVLAYKNPRLRNHKGSAARQYIQQNFTLEKVGKQIKVELDKIWQHSPSKKLQSIIVHHPDLSQSTSEHAYQRKASGLKEIFEAELTLFKHKEEQKRKIMLEEMHAVVYSESMKIGQLIAKAFYSLLKLRIPLRKRSPYSEL
ncbi:MAG: glycosyltransferase family 4 protein [Zetaproteobacteria bacterium]|nr:glycosyltransferase family 4 protein [Zetaproteobacteria bacterium]